MTNLEYYKDEIKAKIKERNNIGCAFCLIKNKHCVCCSASDREDILCNVVDWLLEEHKEHIKLKKSEYGLIKFYDENWRFYNIDVLKFLQKQGHFKGITDTSITLKEILDNCEVVED